MSITPSVAHKKTNKSTPTRRSHRRATEGEDWEAEPGTGLTWAEVSDGDLNSPTLVGSLAKGSLGSEIIAPVVISKPVNKAVGWTLD